MQKSMLSAVAVLALGLPLQAQQTIRCSSQNGQKQFCPANTSNGVRLVRERSDNVCQQGSTWMYTRRGIQVNGGCSAEFEVTGTSGSGGNDSNGNSGNSGSSGYNNDNGNSRNGDSGDSGDSRGSNRDDGGSTRSGNRDRSGIGPNGRQRGLVLPSGTQLTVRLEQAVRSAEVSQGDVIPASLVKDLLVDGNIVATAGTPVQAKIESAQGSPLDLRLESMTVNGRTYVLSTNSVHSLRDSTSAQDSNNQSARSQISGILGDIAGGNQVPSGTVFQFRLVSPSRGSGGANGNRDGNRDSSRENNRDTNRDQ